VLVGPALADTPSAGEWRTFEVLTKVELLKPIGVSHIWLPAPLIRNTPYQNTISTRFTAEGGTARLSKYKPSHVHVLRDSMLIDSEVNDAEPLKPGSSSLLYIFGPDEVSQDRRRCCAILVCQSHLGTGTSKSSEYECAQKSLAKAELKRTCRSNFGIWVLESAVATSG
jgi:hypothetical protein